MLFYRKMLFTKVISSKEKKPLGEGKFSAVLCYLLWLSKICCSVEQKIIFWKQYDCDIGPLEGQLWKAVWYNCDIDLIAR